jgi:DNA (cytosine-5)-methyltransferase 1
MKKFVIDAADPFIVPIANWSGESVQSAHEPLRTVTSWPRGGSFAMASPIIAPATHQGSDRVNDPHDPLPTVTCANRGELTLISPVMVTAAHGEGKPGGVQRWGDGSKFAGDPLGTVTASSGHSVAAAHLVKFRFADEGKVLDEPLPTITSGGNYQRPAGAAHAMGISTVFMAQMNGGFNTTDAKSIEDPMTTVTNTGSQQQLVTANLVHLRGNCDARDARDPLHTISAGGTHHGLVTAFMERQFGASVGQGVDEPAPTITAGGGGKSSLVELQLSPEVEAGALRVAAFLISYYGTENMSAADAPAPTTTTKDRLGLVTVTIKGAPYVIVDICLRMLQPAELYKAQGFPADYIISHGADGKPFTKTQQVHMCGNSVSPPPMAALARANDPWQIKDSVGVAA